MTDILSEVFGDVENLLGIPLEFTQNLAGALVDNVIAAFQAPVPDEGPLTAYRYLNSRRQVLIDGVKQRPLIRMQDKNLTQLATIGQEMNCHFEEIAADTGEAGVVIRGGDYLGDFVRNAVRIEEDLHLSIDPVGTAPTWKTRWGGKITQINVKRDSSGIHTVELIAASNREHFKNILVGSTPWFPPEIQPIKMWMLPANIRTGCMITLFTNLARLFFPLLSVPTNILNPAGWINPLGIDGLANVDPLSWPIQCQFINPILDQSRTSLITAAWTNFHDATVDPLKDAGCMGRIYTWFTEDTDGPHPELEALVGKDLADLARPHRNCLIAAFEDHSGQEGPTGCVSGDTVVQGPDGDERIDSLAAKGKPFSVWSVTPWGDRVAAEATSAFRKGVDELAEFTLDDGRSIKATAAHRFLTNEGFVEAADVEIGTQLATTDHQEPAPEPVPTPAYALDDDLFEDIPETPSVQYRKVLSIQPLGRHDFYDMKVPGWGNYSANGVWSHNTAVDGFINLVATTLDDLITTTVFPVDVDQDGEVDPIFQTLLGVAAPKIPWACYRDGNESGIIESQYNQHKGPTKTVMTGGKSPKLVNDIQTMAIRYGISQIAQAIVLAGELPAVEGLDNIYQGQLDNILFAWERYTDPNRALNTGDMAYQEWLEHPGSAAYTISAVLNLRLANYKKRAFRSFKTSIRNAAPYIINYDILLDDRVGFEQDGIIYVDQMTAIKYEYDRSKPITYTVSVGDGSKDRDPFAQGVKAIQAVYAIAASTLGEGWLF